MYLKEFIDQYKGRNIKIFVDMDGVIADYDVGKASEYDKKRPLTSSISKLEVISKLDNIELFILSVTRKDEGIEQKNYWLNKFAPFFKKENRNIISKESNDGRPAKELKANYIKKVNRDNSIIIVIDDDPEVIKEIQKENPDVVLLKDTVLVD